MADSKPLRSGAFISYSHKDAHHLERLKTYLKPLLRESSLRVWDDTQIKPGDKWKEEIERAIAQARVAVLLVSEHFLASDFIAGEELPKLLAAAQDEGARILPIILSPSVFRFTPLFQFQSINPPSRPLSAMSEHEQGETWVRLAEQIYEALNAPHPIGTTLVTYTGHTGHCYVGGLVA
jgi:internalin A